MIYLPTRKRRAGAQMRLREIEEKDNQAIGQLVQDSLERHQLNIPGTAYFDPYLFELSDYYKQEGAKYWVLEKEGKVIGGCGVGPYDKEKGIGEIQKLYIAEGEQGKGYSHQLIQKALDFAAQNYSACYIETFASLDKANQLYRRYGFSLLKEPLEGSEHNACDTWLLKEF